MKRLAINIGVSNLFAFPLAVTYAPGQCAVIVACFALVFTWEAS